MVCDHCGRETKDGFPYCMSCGEWIGSHPAGERAILGSWGNPGFEKSQAGRLSETTAGR
jgi:hypothetical protein